jgi:hypothetical protein
VAAHRHPLRARLLVNLNENLSVLGAMFDGDQAGPGPGDAQQRNRYGVNFRINDPIRQRVSRFLKDKGEDGRTLVVEG